jgi:hypothetical protein
MPSPRPSPTLAPGRHRGRPARVAVTATLLAACSPPRPSPPRPLSPGPAAGERDRRPQPATWPRSGPRRPGCGPPWTSSTGGWRSGAEDLEEAYAQGSSCWPTPPGWTAGAGRLSGSWPSPRPSCTSGPAAPTSPAPAGSCPAWWAPTIRPARPPPPPWSAPAASAPSSRPPASSSSTASPHPLVQGSGRRGGHCRPGLCLRRPHPPRGPGHHRRRQQGLHPPPHPPRRHPNPPSPDRPPHLPQLPHPPPHTDPDMLLPGPCSSMDRASERLAVNLAVSQR